MADTKAITITVTSHRGAVTSEVEAAIKRALEICGGKAETYAKQLCPVDTGNLRNSITHKQEGDDTELIGTNVEYAPYVEFGHHQEAGRYVAAIGKRLVRDYVPGKPYLTPSLENHVSEYKQVFENELKKI